MMQSIEDRLKGHLDWLNDVLQSARAEQKAAKTLESKAFHAGREGVALVAIEQVKAIKDYVHMLPTR